MTYDVAIIGSGIVGLSVGYSLIKENPDLSIAIIEKEKEVGLHQTGRNSGVMHSGIYYKPGSLKAINCRRGYDLLLDFCREEEIEYDICGKLIVAVDATEEDNLISIYERGLENGLLGLKLLDKEGIKKIEPYVNGTKAVWVPQAGIVSYKRVAERLKQILERNGATFHFNSEVNGISKNKEYHQIVCGKGIINSYYLVNCAGLYSDKIAKMQGVSFNARIIPFRGEYYLLKEDKKHLVKNLVYPVPNPQFPFLGVHFTRRITGEIDAGPNAVLAFSREGYHKRDVRIGELLESITYTGFLKVAIKYWKVGLYELYRSYSKKAFVHSLKKLIPAIEAEDLLVGSSGVRAQLCDSDGNLVDDFVIKYGDRAVHVINAPSPAATSSLQIGRSISEKLAEMML